MPSTGKEEEEEQDEEEGQDGTTTTPPDSTNNTKAGEMNELQPETTGETITGNDSAALE